MLQKDPCTAIKFSSTDSSFRMLQDSRLEPVLRVQIDDDQTDRQTDKQTDRQTD